ncbi:MAG: hypothetical protein PHT94_04085 [Candidatus Nanoarchaeia archaeon]|nr:hypothetical protein [Candidatus Nanoarchaeia archaeon]
MGFFFEDGKINKKFTLYFLINIIVLVVLVLCSFFVQMYLSKNTVEMNEPLMLDYQNVNANLINLSNFNLSISNNSLMFLYAITFLLFFIGVDLGFYIAFGLLNQKSLKYYFLFNLVGFLFLFLGLKFNFLIWAFFVFRGLNYYLMNKVFSKNYSYWSFLKVFFDIFLYAFALLLFLFVLFFTKLLFKWIILFVLSYIIHIIIRFYLLSKFFGFDDEKNR